MAESPPGSRPDFLWLLFRLRGRIGRQVFLLANLLIFCAVAFPYYRYALAVAESRASDGWAAVFGVVFIAALWSTIALGVKRLHDLGKPGALAVSLVLPVISIVAFVALCLLPGMAGPNEHGERADEPG